MVTNVSMQEKIATAVQDMNDLKDKVSKVNQTLAEQEKAFQKYQETSTKYQSEIEDIYVPSFDFNKTDSESYTKNLGNNKLDIIDNATTFDEFRSYLGMQVEKDFADQHHTTDICASYSNRSVQEYLNNIDYKKEYEEYKKSRGCATDDELKLVVYAHFKTKDRMYDWAADHLNSAISSIEVNGIIPHNIFVEGVNPKSLVRKASTQDIYNYINNDCDQHNLKGTVFAAQSFVDLLSKQDNINVDTRKALKGLSQDITFAKGLINSFSDEIDRINAQSFYSSQQYNASLIAKYNS